MCADRILPVAVTCGDPSGIGLEVTLAAWQALDGEFPFFIIADPGHFPDDAPVVVIDHPSKAEASMPHGLPVLMHAFAMPSRPGKPQSDNARGVVEVIAHGVRLVQQGEASALCTAPISKKQLADYASFAFPGHTEFLAHLAGTEDPVMMLAAEELKVVPATIHIPLKDVPQALTVAKLEATIRTVHDAMIHDFGIARPRIAVAGLNPHAGEGGLLGGEDIAVIQPVCERLQAVGMDITGPLPADTMFHAEARAQYDVAVAMYHDQALIPIKTLAFDRGVNVTLGLPFVRTSPDHGTAFDIAGKGLANPTSMIEALRMASSMGRTRARRQM